MGAKTTQQRERPERMRLDRDRILDVAEEIAATEGIAKLTMRRLGDALDANHTAIYRHFRDKDELMFTVADRLFGDGPELDLSKGWREAARQQITYSFDRYRVHPDLAQLLALQPNRTMNLERIIERALTAFEAAGLTAEQAARVYHVFEHHVVGSGLYYSLLQHAHGRSGQEREGERRAYATLPVDRFPRAVAAAPHLFPDPVDTFALATELLLDAIECMALQGVASTSNKSEQP